MMNGIESPAGTPWNNSVISRILANPPTGCFGVEQAHHGKINGVARDGTLRPKRERGIYHKPAVGLVPMRMFMIR